MAIGAKLYGKLMIVEGSGTTPYISSPVTLLPPEYTGMIRAAKAVNIDEAGHEILAKSTDGKPILHFLAPYNHYSEWMPQIMETFTGLTFDLMDSGILYIYFEAIDIPQRA